MKIIILAAGQGTRLKPLTDECPKCMVKVNGVSMIDRQIETIKACGIKEEAITIVTGYKSNALEKHFQNSNVHFIKNKQYETTNMVCSFMSASALLESEDDVIISYGDIIYEEQVFLKILNAKTELSVVVDDGWHSYWLERCDNPLDDAETLMYDSEDFLVEIGQKTNDLSRVQSQYIGLMRFQGIGVRKVLDLANQAKQRTLEGNSLWRTVKNYSQMYMTDLLQGLIDEGNQLKAIHIERGWYEVDDCEDLQLVERKLKEGEY